MLDQLAFRRVHQAVGLVAGFSGGAALLVFLGKGLGIAHHLVDIVLGKAARRLNTDLLFLAGALVLGVDRNKAVGIDVEGHFDLRHTARRGRNAHQIELAQDLVVRRHLALTLEHPDGHGRLVVVGGGIDLALLGRDRGVAIDHAGEHAAQRFDAQRKRGHVEQQHVLHVALQHAGLDGGAHGHHFIRVHAGVGLLAEQFLHELAHARHAGHAADQDHFIQIASLHAGFLDGIEAGLAGALDQVEHQLFQIGAGDVLDEVLRPVLIGGDEGQVHFGRGRGRQLDLGLFRGFLQALQSQLVLGQVDAFGLLEIGREEFHQLGVKVFAAQEGVTGGRLHFEHAIAQFEDGDIEGAAAKIVNGDGLGVVLLVEAIGQRSGGRLVDDAQHFKAGDLAGVLGGLALGVVEIGRHGDHGLGHGFAQIGFSRFLHLLQDEGGNLRRAVILATGIHPGIAIGAARDGVGHKAGILGGQRIVKAAADQTLHGKDGVGRVGDGLALGRLAHKALAILGERDLRRRGARAFGIFDHLRRRAFHHGHAAVGGAQIDPDNLRHGLSLPVLWARTSSAP